jgi:enoyl-CoA hydratase/carnithine racemase
METLAYERTGPVGWLRLNRPDKLNAQTPAMWSELAKLGAELSGDPEIRAMVVIGEGRAFSSGIDLAELMALGNSGLFAEAGTTAGDSEVKVVDPRSDRLVTSILEVQEAFTWLEKAPFASVAAIRGYAFGAGLQLALACDLRVVARGTKLGAPEHRYGLVPDLGATWRLPAAVGPAKAKELILTGETIEAEEAHRIGLANRLCDDAELEAVAGALAEKLAAQPPIAMRHSKALVDAAPSQTTDEARLAVAAAQAECIRSADFLEALAATSERRAPNYQNR